MACCGPSKINPDMDSWLKTIRNNEENISLKLDSEIYKFVPKESKWKSNLFNYINFIIT